MGLIYPDQIVKIPPNPAVDYRNTITRDLTALIVANRNDSAIDIARVSPKHVIDGSRSIPAKLFRQITWDNGALRPERVHTPVGIGITNFDDLLLNPFEDWQDVSWSRNEPSGMPDPNPFSAIVYFYQMGDFGPDTTIIAGQSIFGTYNGHSTSGWTLGADVAAGYRYGVNGFNGGATVTTARPTSPGLHMLGFSGLHTGGNPGLTTIRLFLDGLLDAVAGPATNYGADSGVRSLKTREYGNSRAVIIWGGCWRRSLSDAEMASLWKTPFQLFLAPRAWFNLYSTPSPPPPPPPPPNIFAGRPMFRISTARVGHYG